MGQHSMTLGIRFRAWRRRRRQEREDRHQRQVELAEQVEYQARLVDWKHHRQRLVEQGLLPEEAEWHSGPMPIPPSAPPPATDHMEPR